MQICCIESTTVLIAVYLYFLYFWNKEHIFVYQCWLISQILSGIIMVWIWWCVPKISRLQNSKQIKYLYPSNHSKTMTITAQSYLQKLPHGLCWKKRRQHPKHDIKSVQNMLIWGLIQNTALRFPVWPQHLVHAVCAVLSDILTFLCNTLWWDN